MPVILLVSFYADGSYSTLVSGNATPPLRGVLGPPGGLTSRMEIILQSEKQEEDHDVVSSVA